MNESSHPQSETATVDSLIGAFSNESNRCVLSYLREEPGTAVSLDELARYVDRNRSGVDRESPDRTAIYLHHVSLPKLAAAGVVDYDHHSKTITCQDHPVLERGFLGSLIDSE